LSKSPTSEDFSTSRAGDATIGGNNNDDRFIGGSGDDILTGHTGNDHFEGGAGIDTVVLGLTRHHATVVVSGANGTVTGTGIADTFTSVERLRFIDGTLSYGPDTVEAQAARLYQACFGRAPDASGLSYWAGVLQGGRSLDDIASGFIASAEFTTHHGEMDDDGFVNSLYHNALGRDADAPGSAYWRGALATGSVNRSQMLANFAESAENKTRTASLVGAGLWAPDANAASAARLYYTTLGRGPDADGLSYWTSQINSGAATLQQEAHGFVTSAEFTARYGSLDDSAFVNLLYHNVLGRSADQAGLAFWSNDLAHGGNRTSVVLSFSESVELKTRLAPYIEDHGIVVS
jgi:hypothetical protein